MIAIHKPEGKLKDANTNDRANSSINIFNSNEEHSPLHQETKKKKNKKKKKKKKSVDEVVKEKIYIPEKSKKIKEKTINDENYEKKSNYKTIISNEEKCIPEVLRSNIIKSSTKYFSAMEDQKIMIDVEQKDANTNDRANSSINIFNSNEEHSPLLQNTMKNKQKKKSVDKVVNQEKKFIQDFCDKEFIDASALSKHQTIHNNFIKCKDCSITLKEHSLFLNHCGSHSMNQIIECKDCNKTFTKKSNFTRHYRIHSGKQPYACDICGKSFTQKANLNNHYRIHTGEQPYTCDICGKSFIQKANLKTHYRIHTGEQPYTCDICGKSFVQKSHLITHYRIHSGDRPYMCDTCSKSFSQKSALVSHVQLHTGDKP